MTGETPVLLLYWLFSSFVVPAPDMGVIRISMLHHCRIGFIWNDTIITKRRTKCEHLERNEIPLQMITRKKVSGSANQLQHSRPPGPKAKLHVYQRQPNRIEEKCCQEGAGLDPPPPV
ncbi:MAG: hypothetical protein C0394_04800 [Syntrophus sp. (in: bacteria)]|nr:hypothetical protein [Syntrophus sp. (in: bacteria)]